MITTYCTDNYYRWAKLFLKSWAITNNTDEKIHISTLNFSDEQIIELQGLYDNLIISNQKMGFGKVCKKLGMSQKEFAAARVAVAEGVRNIGNNRKVISFFAVDKRVESIYNTMNTYQNEDYFIQCDIDLLFRKPINVIDNGLDAGLRFKLHRERTCKKINIGFMWLNNNKKTMKLVNDWYNVVNSEPLEKRDTEDLDKNMWGQWTFHQAYEMNKNDLKCFTMSDHYFDNQYRDETYIWSANRRIRGNKTNTYEYLQSEYKNNIHNRR